MKVRLFAISILGCALWVTAQDSAAPVPDPPKPSSAAEVPDGKIVAEMEVDGKLEKRLLDLNDPATCASLQGKVIITTEINGKKESRVVDFKNADKLLPPWMFNEKPPVRTGPVTFLGVATMEVPKEVSAQLPLMPDTGLLIGAVAPDSPAAKAGLQDSDVLSRFDDQILITQRQLAVLIANHKEGDAVKLTYFRKGQQMETTATLGQHIAAATMEQADPLARVTRRLLTINEDGTALPDRLLEKVRSGDKTMLNAADREILELLKANGGFHESRAEQEVGRDIRKALEQLPAEVRPQVEKLLRESGAVPKGALPSVPQAPPVAPQEK